MPKASTLTWIVLLAALAVLPLVNDNSYLRHIAIVALLYAALVSSWNLTLGFAGVFNFGHMAFFAVGAYAAAILTQTFGLSPWLGMAAGIVSSVIASVIVCLPVLRLKGIYVVLVTFAFGQLCYQVVLNQRDITGGTFGIVSIPPLEIFGWSFASSLNIGYYYFALVMLVASTIYVKRLVTSDFGRTVIALRDNETYAVSRGVATAKIRLLIFIASAVFPGAIGALYAFYVRSASPDLFGFSLITLGLSMLLVGGIGTVWGPLIGAATLTVVSELMADLGPGRYLVIAAMIILVLRFLPGGLVAAGDAAARILTRGVPKTNEQERSAVGGYD
jgi:ABC-type branched-subunit amino acid transport system permease subunit